MCEGKSPRSVLGVAVAEDVEGPYKKVASFLWSGGANMSNGKSYDATVDPNVIDPHVFFDKEGKLWLLYGSYSGGIFILEMDPGTGLPKETNSYGTKLLGGNHARIEGPYMLYNPDTDYYYLFTSFGGLDASGGYNIRVARSKSVTGPFTDMQDNKMSEAKGRRGIMFDDLAIQNYGTKLIGNLLWDYKDNLFNRGYLSPGHNSAIYDKEKNAYFILFHTRFPMRGEEYEGRVHQLLFNEDGWPMIVPRRYAGEKIADFRDIDVSGNYMMIRFENEISAEKQVSENVQIDHKKVTGAINGKLIYPKEKTQDFIFELENEPEIKGKFISVWDDYMKVQSVAFTGFDHAGQAVMFVKKVEQ